MAWLFLDTHAHGDFRYGWLDGATVDVRTGTGRSSVLLPKIASLVKRRRPEGVCVVRGPGSFSAVRTGVLYGNLLARLLQVPLAGVTVAEVEDLSAVASDLAAGRIPPEGYVSPVYDAEPNITLPKRA